MHAHTNLLCAFLVCIKRTRNKIKGCNRQRGWATGSATQSAKGAAVKGRGKQKTQEQSF